MGIGLSVNMTLVFILKAEVVTSKLGKDANRKWNEHGLIIPKYEDLILVTAEFVSHSWKVH